MSPPGASSSFAGAANRAALRRLARYECQGVTFIADDGSWPIVWERARGSSVWDLDGRRYMDLTAAFGVAAAGHANPRVVRAAQAQLARLTHAMGDVHPHRLKGELARVLSRITFERWTARGPGPRLAGKILFCNSGFEAVEAALKSALLATGRPGVAAFEGAYHGLGYGALNATHRDHFRLPFRPQLRGFADFLPFPSGPADLGPLEEALEEAFRARQMGAILAEPIQGRGGIRVPPPGFLPLLRRCADRHGALLILDEVFTGFGRTGRWFACEHDATVPDAICLGKALTGGFPLSACVGRAELMDRAWPRSTGEAIHTSTFLGHPVGCAMALAQIAEIRRRGLVERSERLGNRLLGWLESLQSPPAARLLVRGRGLMAGVEVCGRRGSPWGAMALGVIGRLLHRGFVLLPEGAASSVISFTPPLTIGERELRRAVAALQQALDEEASP